MSWESERGQEQKDRTKLLWLGVGIMIAVMVLSIWISTGRNAVVTRARVKHILIGFDGSDPADRARALDTAQKLRERLLAGESFVKLAKDYSDDPGSVNRGGDLGWNEKDTLTGSVEEFVWEGPLNQLSEIILSSYGYHLVIVSEREISEADIYEQQLRRRTRETLREETNEAPPPASQ